MNKGDLLLTKAGDQAYMMVGRWDRDVVLAPVGSSEQVLIYSEGDLQELLASGSFVVAQEMPQPEPPAASVLESLEGITKDVLGIGTLETRHMDRLDFHDVSVWSLREALERAFNLGKEGVKNE